MNKTVFLAGYYGFGNTGDEIILQTIVRQLRSRFPDLSLLVTSGSGEPPVAGADPILWSDTIAMGEAISRSDLVLLGGGGLFHDYWGFDPNNALADGHWGISYYTAPAVFGALHGKPVMLYGVGVGPLLSGHGKAFTKAVCDAADVITVRDGTSAGLLAEIGVPSQRVSVTADPAFAFEPDLDEGRRLAQSFREGASRLVAVVVRPWEFGVAPTFWEREVARALDLFLRTTPATIVMVPFQHLDRSQENDLAVAERTRSYMERKGQVRIAPTALTPEQKFALLGQCDLVVAMRLHAALAAIRGGVPAVSIIYDPKMDHLAGQLGLHDWAVNVGSLDAPRLASLLHAALDARALFASAGDRLRRELAPAAGRNLELAAQLIEQGRRSLPFTPELADVILRSLQRQIEDVRWLSGERRQLTAEVETLRAETVSLHSRIEQAGAEREALEQEQHHARLALEASLEREALVQADLEKKLKERQAAEQRLEQEHARYRSDKETYIATLTQRVIAAERRPWFVFRSLVAAVWSLAAGLLSRLLPRSVRALLYDFDKDLLTLEPKVRARMASSVRKRAQQTPVKASLISTVFNEGESIGAWLQSLLAMSRLPDELVIVDAGSRDGTVDAIKRFQQTAPFPVEVLIEAGANIARGRNLAVAHARYPVIACTDAGCRVHPLWLETLLAPFEADPDTEVVAGWTEPKAETPFERSVADLFVARRTAVDFERYLPSSRTIAFARHAFEAVGGYPDWLTMWAEDSYFAIRLRNECTHWVVEPNAIVYWESRRTWRAVARQAYRYGFGDGEAGLHSANYVTDLRILRRAVWMFLAFAAVLAASLRVPWGHPWLAPLALLAAAAFFFVNRVRTVDRIYSGAPNAHWSDSLRKVGLLYVIFASRLTGYVRGLRNRPAILSRRYAGVKGCAVIFSGVPIDDSGGGQRATQLALELLQQGWRVVFLNQYPRYETVDLNLRITHPHLEVYPVPAFDVEQFLATRLPGQPAFAIAEFPHPAFVAPLKRLRAGGVSVFYDLIDDWRSSLGGDWYSIAVEQEYLEFSHHLLASAGELVTRLKAMGAPVVQYVPNAVNRRLFVWRDHPRPADMPRGEFTILYIGALWGHWFDWNLLVDVALAYPSAAVVVIGDYHGQCPRPAPNLYFLGLKAQRDLPPYLANADVALIPFKPSELTQAVSPLKVFEYLAMKLPVVSTPLKELERLPYVHLAATAEEFIEAVGTARSSQVDDAVIERFLEEHSWPARVRQILDLL